MLEMLKKKQYAINEFYNEKFNLVLGIRYGREGIVPCLKQCNRGCVSSSGSSLCGSFSGSKEIEVEGTQLFIVMCLEKISCDRGIF
jgi:hypothetical protein